ncbi:MAG TPA: molybdopterin cofactor-binding domain-containing protein [Candidatus Limnocylindrales bacterium]|nr:molybdopterin cofactor-binding domain-containing protein [Candidatus Limnocylindrales bacterium]
MNEHPLPPETAAPEIEVERYELRSPATYHFVLQRRDFFKLLGAGLLVACLLKDAVASQESGRGRRSEESLPREISAWLHIGDNGIVTVYTGKVEVGQNIRTSLSQAVAEELHFPIEKIELVMGDTKLTPYDMGTFGSRTTPTMNLHLRQVAAAARDVLLGLAAQQWNTKPEALVAADGEISDPSTKQHVEYAALVKNQQLTELIPAQDPLAPATDWKIEGQPISKIDGRDFVTGRHKYPSDQKLTGMLHGKVLRAPSFGATLTSLVPPDAASMTDVTFVHDGDFVGAAALSPEAASRALASIRAEWKPGPDQPSSKNIYDYLKTHPAEGERGETPFEVGSIESGLSAADHRLHQTYTVAYIAHAPLEPRAALAQWSADSLTVWTGTQRPFGVRSELAQAFHIPEENVRVLMPDTGAAYGGKHTGEVAVEAARLARAANRPVKLVWTREEEFTWAYFRPVGVMDVSAGVRNDGTLTAWEFHNYNSGGSGIRTFYEVPNQRIQFHATDYPLRQGSYRALAATANHFARESFMDELAHEVKMDPLEFRLKNLKNDRLRAVFEAAAKKFGWGRTKTPGHGFGMGGGFEKGGNVATFAEVSADPASGDVRVLRVVTAFECGAIVNPDNLCNQIEGGNIMGLGGALFESIEFENGKILNPHFAKYRVPRFSEIPAFETVLLDRKDIPSAGAGESPLMGIAPAIGNAIFDAAGVRLRSMPMVPNGLPKA